MKQIFGISILAIVFWWVIIDSRARNHVIDFGKYVADRTVAAVNSIGSDKPEKPPAKR